MRYRYKSQKIHKKDGLYIINRHKRQVAIDRFNASRNIDRSEFTEDGFMITQTWVGLRKAWTAYILSKWEGDVELQRYYAGVIQKLEYQLKVPMEAFPELSMTIAGFFADNAKYLSNEITGEELELIMEKQLDKLKYMIENNIDEVPGN